MPVPPPSPPNLTTTLVTNPVSGTNYYTTATHPGTNYYDLTVQPGGDTKRIEIRVLSPGANPPSGPTYMTVNGLAMFSQGGALDVYSPVLSWNAHGYGTLLVMNATTVQWTAPSTPGTYLVSNDYSSGSLGVVSSNGTWVTVVAAPTASLTGGVTITNGGSCPLTPSFTGGTGVVQPGSISVTSGTSFNVSPTSNTTYTLTVTNAAGDTATSSTTVIVVAAPSISSFTASPSPITAGATSNLVPTFSGGTCYIGTSPGGTQITANASSGSSYSVTPGTTTIYYMTVTNAAGATATAQVQITVLPVPTASIVWSSAGTVPYGTWEGVTATFSGGTAVIGSSQGASDWVNGATSGTLYGITSSLTGTLTAWVRVTNGAGTSVDASATVSVQTPAIAAITGGGGYVTTGYTRTLSTTVTGAVNTNVNWTVNTGSVSPTTTASGANTTFTAGLPGVATFTAYAVNGATVQTTITVVAAPAISSFTTNKTTSTTGSQVVLTPTFSNGTGSIDNGIGAVSSGTSYSVYPTSSTTYTLTVTNQAGQTATSTVNVTVIPNPSISSFTASPSSISAGSSSTLTGSFTGGTGSINQSVGAVTSGVGKSVTNITTTTTYTLTVDNGAGTTTTANATVTVYPLPAASSLTNSSPGSKLTVGQSTTITPTFSNGTGAVVFSGVSSGSLGAVTSGSGVSSGALNTPGVVTFTLTVTNPVGATAQTTTAVTVYAMPVASSLTSTSTTITAGSSVTITPTFSSGTGSIDNGVGAVTSGSGYVVSPASTTTFTLTVTNPAGYSVTQNVTITVVAAPTIPTFTTSLAAVTDGTTVTLVWTTTGATSASINQGVGSVGVNSSTIVTPPSSAATTYTLTATNAAGTSVTRTVTVTAWAPPTISSFTSSSLTPLHGASVNLNGVYTAPGGGTATVDNGIGAISSGVDKATPTLPTNPVQSGSAPITYTLTVTNVVGASTTASVTITPQLVVVGTPTPAGAIGVNTTKSYSATVTGAVDTTVTWSHTGVTGSWVGNQFTPTSTGTATIRATSVANAAKNSSNSGTGDLTVVTAASPTGSLAASTLAPLRGATNVTITPTHNGSSAIIGTTLGGSDISANAATGVSIAVQTGGFTSPITYYLRVTSLAGVVYDAPSVTITPQTVSVAVSPTTASPQVGGTVNLTATVTGATDNTVTWSVATVGSGLTPSATTAVFVAPAVPGTYTIYAASVSDPTKNATCVITIPTVTISASAVKTTLLAGETTNCSATVTNAVNTAVTWSIDGGASAVNGSITVGGVYTAGTGTGTVVRATSVADATKSATITMTVSAITVSVAPTSTSVAINGTTTLTPTVSGAVVGLQGVTWSVDGGATYGTVNSSGVYTAPATSPSGGIATVRATSTANPAKSGTSAVTVVNLPVISGFTSSVVSPQVGQTYTLTATFSGGTGSVNQGVGAVTSGTPTAPRTATLTAVTFTLTATNAISGSTQRSLTVTPQTVSVSVLPTTKTLLAGESATFASSVTGAVDTSVIWSTTYGTINASGQFTAPLTSVPGNTLTVTATSVADPSKSASATVTMTPVVVTVLATKVLTIGTTFTTPATVTGAVNTSVTWSIASGVGSVSNGNTYNASTVGTSVLRATSVIDPTKYADCVITVVGAGEISSFSATSPNYGGFAVLTPVFASGTATITPTLPGNPSIIRSGQGYDTGPLTAKSNVFTLTVTNAAGDHTSVDVTVTVPTVILNGPTVPGVAASNTAIVLVNSVTKISATATYCVDTSVSWTCSVGNLSVSTSNSPDNFIYWTAPSVAHPLGDPAYITATSVADPTITRTIPIIVAYPVYSGKKSALASS